MQPRLATTTDRDPVVATIVAAFEGDPAFGWFFGADDFPELCQRFAGHLFDRRVAKGTAWVGHDGDVVALWDGPTAPNSVGDDQLVDALDLPDDARARLDAYDRAVHHALPSAPHWYLGILACHPDRRGGGLARQLAAHGLQRAGADRVPAFLETSAPGNVGIYEKAGWRVEAELDDAASFPVWVMRHDGVM